MKYLASEYDVGYPLRGAKFLDDSILLVTGGGGQANRDIPNKLTALKVDFNKKKTIKRFREIKLDATDDCPTTLDAAEVHSQGSSSNVILMGCNETTSDPSVSPNHHLRKFTFENDHLKFIASADFNRSNDPSEYNKLTSLSSDGSVAAIASSKLPTVIRILDPLKMEEKYEIESGNEVKDLHFSPDGKVICYITETTLEVISIVTGRFIIRKTDFNKKISLSKVRFLTNDVVAVIGIVDNKSKDITISTINIQTKNTKVILSKAISSGYTGITAMDASKDGQLIALATDKHSLLIVKSKNLSVTRSFKNIHQGDISSVVFSPNSEFVASVSLANTIHVVKLPPGLAQSTSFFHVLFKLLLNILLTVGIIGVAYVAYYFDLHTKSYHYINEKYLTKRDTSDYFHMNNGIVETSTEIIGDIVSVHTLTRDINTDSKINTKEADNNMSITATSDGIGALSTSIDSASDIEEAETTAIYEESLSLTLVDTTSSTPSEVLSTVAKITSHTSTHAQSLLSTTVSEIEATTDINASVTESSNSSVSSDSRNTIENLDSVASSALPSMATSLNSSTPSSAVSSDSLSATISESPKTVSITTSATSLNASETVKPNELVESVAKILTGNSTKDTLSVSVSSPQPSLPVGDKPVSGDSIVSTNASTDTTESTHVASKKEESTQISNQAAKSTTNNSSKSVDISSAKPEKTVATLANSTEKQVNSIAKHTITVDGVVYEVVPVSPAPTQLSSESASTASTVSTSSVLSETLTSSNAAVLETTSISDSKPTSQEVTPTAIATELLSSIPSLISETIEPLTSVTMLEQDLTSSGDETLSDATSSIISTIVSEISTQTSEITAEPAHYHTNVQPPNFRHKTVESSIIVDDETTNTPLVSTLSTVSTVTEIEIATVSADIKTESTVSTGKNDIKTESTASADNNEIITDSTVLSDAKETPVTTEPATVNKIEDNDNDITVSLATSHSAVADGVAIDNPTVHKDTQLETQKTVASTSSSLVEVSESKNLSKASAKVESTSNPVSSVVSETNEPTQPSSAKEENAETSVKEENTEASLKEEIDSVSDSITSHIRAIVSGINDEASTLTMNQAPDNVVTEKTDIGHDEL